MKKINHNQKISTTYFHKNQFGTTFYYKNGLWHREDGPAIEWASGAKSYYINGECHRIGGPALISATGHEDYYVYDNEVSKEAHDLLYNLMKLKGIEIKNDQ